MEIGRKPEEKTGYLKCVWIVGEAAGGNKREPESLAVGSQAHHILHYLTVLPLRPLPSLGALLGIILG